MIRRALASVAHGSPAIPLAVAAVGLVLAGCGAQAATSDDPVNQGTDGSLYQVTVHLKDDTSVLCVAQATTNGNGGVSCDWDNRR